MGFSCLTITYVRMSKYVTNRVNVLFHLMEICTKSPISQTLTICGAKSDLMTRHFLCLLVKVAVNVSRGEQTFPQIMADFSLFVH